MIYLLTVFMYANSSSAPAYIDYYHFKTEAECLAKRKEVLDNQYMPTEATCEGPNG